MGTIVSPNKMLLISLWGRPETLSCLRLYRDNGKENGNYRDYRRYIGGILGLYRDNGKENGNCYKGVL